MLAVAGDEQLPVAAARTGEATAWDVLFRRYQLPLYVYVMELLHNEQTALDVVQETFISATRHVASLREDKRFGSWLFSIAHQKCLQHWRKPKNTESIEDSLTDYASESPLPLDLIMRAEQEDEFMSALNELPEVQRSVLLLHFLEEFPLAEIAAITMTSVGTVKSRLHYAKKSLRTLLTERSK